MKVILASGLGNATLRGCIEALLASEPSAEVDLHVIRERETREATWNAGLDLAGRDDDVLFLGDDVLLTTGWLDALRRGAERADVVGLSTLHPGTDVVQDRGYDLVRVDGRVTVEAQDRGRTRREVAPFQVRPCDAVCGCCVFVKREVLAQVPRFRPEEGANRWGERVFAHEARRAGFRVGVVDHHVYHAGNGTKANPDPALASTSAVIERELWERVVSGFVDPAWVTCRRESELDPDLRARVEAPGARVLVYGVGTVAETLVREARLDPERVAFATGLREEVGHRFHGREVLDVREAPLHLYDTILLTPLHRGEKLLNDVVGPLLPEGFAGEVCAVEKDVAAGRECLRARVLVGAAG